ncbi:MAG TPA: class I SAM-dependent methyltransferase [Candidatus Acidoferrum sp.]|jgi:SAM-dependent methyltransferase|nr:class I SAM-dependent methyltransferase [Candidatus Acidoferrum sp.]
MTFADAKQRFSSRVADYIRYRPGYPSEVLPLLGTECGLKPGHVVADIGSGTGFLSELFLKNGNRVYGIEPNDAMREAGEEYLASFDNFSSIVGSAEATTLEAGSVDFVSAGQAFHWFEPNATRTEFRRILKANGWMVVLWNDRQTDTPFADAYQNLLAKWGTDYKRVREAYPEAHAMQEFFGAVTVSRKVLPNEQVLDWDGLVGRLRSSSYAPGEGHPNYAPMLADLEQLFRASEKDGRVRMQFATHVYYGRLANQG